MQEPCKIEAVWQVILHPGGQLRTQLDNGIGGVSDGLLRGGPVLTVLKSKVLIYFGRDVQLDAFEVPLDGILQVLLVDEV